MLSEIGKEIRATLSKQLDPRPLEEQRRAWEEAVIALPLPPGVTLTALELAGVACELLRHPVCDPDKRLMLLHGGGFTTGSCITHRQLAAQLVLATRIPVVLVEYRLAPEYPFPAGIEDAVRVYQALLASGSQPEQIAISGDSAGGGLAISALLALRDQGIPLPAAAILLSPWLDIALGGETIQTRAALDPMILEADLNNCAALYIGTADPRDPLASPVYADLRGLPPLQIHVGDHELLLSDSVRIAEQAQAAGVAADLVVWEELWHVFPAWAPDLPEGRQALEQIGAYLREKL